VKVDRKQVLGYRVAAHGLHRETSDATKLAVLDLGIQHASVDSVRAALAARLPTGAEYGGADLATVWSFRGAPHLLRRGDLATLATELWPRGEADATTRLGGEGSALRKAGMSRLEAITATAKALRAVVTVPITKGEASAAVTERLPAACSYWCRGCGATHVYNTLWQLTGLAAGVELLPRTGPTTLGPINGRGPVPAGTAGAQRPMRSYLALHGPATVAEAAGYLGTNQKEAREMWPDGLVEIEVDGRVCYLPEDRVDELRTAPPPGVVRLLPALDPWLQARDRELIVPREADRKALWRILGNPGGVLAGGEIVGTWRAKVAGKRRLQVGVTAFGRLSPATRKAIEAEAEVLAAARGAAEVSVGFDAG
jgi:hypothetical protein